MTVTELRKNIFKVFEEMEKTGKPVEVSRKGEKFLIQPVKSKKSKLQKLMDFKPRKVVVGDIDEVANMSGWDENDWRELEVIDEMFKNSRLKNEAGS